jgi:hypothetical protein
MKKGKFGIVLALTTAAGTIATIVLTAKKAPEAKKMKEEALQRKREETGNPNAELTLTESIQAQAPCYGPVIATGAITMLSMVGSQILPQDALKDLDQLHRTYKQMNEKLNGPGANKITENLVKLSQVTDGKRKETFVFKFDGHDILFESTLLDVLSSEYNVNRCFIGLGEITFNEMLDVFHLQDRHQEGGDDVGWQAYLGEAFYGYTWIDFEHRRGMLDGKPVTFIDMPFDCHALTEEELMGDEFNSVLANHGIEAMW